MSLLYYGGGGGVVVVMIVTATLGLDAKTTAISCQTIPDVNAETSMANATE